MRKKPTENEVIEGLRIQNRKLEGEVTAHLKRIAVLEDYERSHNILANQVDTLRRLDRDNRTELDNLRKQVVELKGWIEELKEVRDHFLKIRDEDKKEITRLSRLKVRHELRIDALLYSLVLHLQNSRVLSNKDTDWVALACSPSLGESGLLMGTNAQKDI